MSKRYIVTGTVEIPVYTAVEAESEEKAVEIAKERRIWLRGDENAWWCGDDSLVLTDEIVGIEASEDDDE